MIVTFSDVLLTWHNSVMCGWFFEFYNRKVLDIVQILRMDGMELVLFVLMQDGRIVSFVEEA